MVRDPEWLDEDVEAAIEWVEWKADLCGCGHPRSETFTEDAERQYEAKALKCHACAERDRLARKWRDDENANPAGLYFAVSRVDEDDDE